MKTWLFAALAALQLALPLSMIAKYESVLAFGKEFKFRCAPVDPADPLRGRYVALNFEAKGFEAGSGWTSRASTRWAELGVDESGFAFAKSSSERKPSSGDFMRYGVRYGRPLMPFKQYFMNEQAAPEAEAAYRRSTRRQRGDNGAWKSDAYLLVKVWRGCAVGERLFIDGRPVEELRSGKGL